MLSRDTDSDLVRGSGWLLATSVGRLPVSLPELSTPTTSCMPAPPRPHHVPSLPYSLSTLLLSTQTQAFPPSRRSAVHVTRYLTSNHPFSVAEGSNTCLEIEILWQTRRLTSKRPDDTKQSDRTKGQKPFRRRKGRGELALPEHVIKVRGTAEAERVA